MSERSVIMALAGSITGFLTYRTFCSPSKILDDIKDEDVKAQMVGQMMALLMNKSQVQLTAPAV